MPGRSPNLTAGCKRASQKDLVNGGGLYVEFVNSHSIPSESKSIKTFIRMLNICLLGIGGTFIFQHYFSTHLTWTKSKHTNGRAARWHVGNMESRGVSSSYFHGWSQEKVSHAEQCTSRKHKPFGLQDWFSLMPCKETRNLIHQLLNPCPADGTTCWARESEGYV